MTERRSDSIKISLNLHFLPAKIAGGRYLMASSVRRLIVNDLFIRNAPLFKAFKFIVIFGLLSKNRNQTLKPTLFCFVSYL
jgi:hypothetical protein